MDDSATAPASRAPRIIPAGKGRTFAMMGIEITPKVTAEDTEGAFSLLEEVVAPQAASPPHSCQHHDKTLHILEGRFEVLLGDRRQLVDVGACVWIPRGTAHNFRNVGLNRGRLLVLISPAGHERFLEQMSQLMRSGAPDREKMQQLCEQHHVQMIHGKPAPDDPAPQ